MLKNRTFIGIIAIVLGVLICFGIAPIFTRMMEAQIDVVMLRSPVKQGEKLEDKHIIVVKMGANNMPPVVLKETHDAIGMYAKSNLYMGSLLLEDMLSETADNSDSRLRTLKENEMAMSVTIKSFSMGLSGQLIPGDIIRIVSVDNDKNAVIHGTINR
ncbi:MAG: SAF domain-containing protein [Oscillospiraceae bacterium]|nr:SAF domain-containing protein [Oscillospiraceae bacterium]